MFHVRGLGKGVGSGNYDHSKKRKVEQELIQPLTKVNSNDDATSVYSIDGTIDDTIFDALRFVCVFFRCFFILTDNFSGMNL